MALVRISTVRLVHLTAALFLVLAIMSCTSPSGEAGCGGSTCRNSPPPPPLKVDCFVPEDQFFCQSHYCPNICISKDHSIKRNSITRAYCNYHVDPHECCCIHR
ncbi:unnamed protein product [Urochloa decumbens]|uniref:Uncharacterized protein n=1 Tax=Urochloa decumbens TaxID=240449 RepID=A0ABC9AP66_9POAL